MDIYSILIEFIADLFAILIYSLSSHIKKDQNLWIFGTWSGEAYNDNSKYLFEYVQKNHPEIRAVWLAKRNYPILLVRKKGYEAYNMHSPYGIWLAIKAGFAICSVSLHFDFYRAAISKQTKCIYLSHGLGPKNMTLPAKHIKPTFSSVIRQKLKITALFITRRLHLDSGISDSIIPYDNWNRYNAVMTLSQVSKEKTIRSHGVNPTKVHITGYPRNEVFFGTNIEKQPIDQLVSRLKNHGIKIGLYAPTYRKEGKINIIDMFVKEAENLGKKLQKQNVYLFVKLHNWNRDDIKKTNARLRHIHLLSDDEINQDIYPLLTKIDFLITDYSSIYVDFLLSGKPIIFAPFDREEYEKTDRGFYFDYDSITPGPKVKDWKDVYYCITHLNSDSKDYGSRLDQVKYLLHDVLEGVSNENIVKMVNNLEYFSQIKTPA